MLIHVRCSGGGGEDAIKPVGDLGIFRHESGLFREMTFGGVGRLAFAHPITVRHRTIF